METEEIIGIIWDYFRQKRQEVRGLTSGGYAAYADDLVLIARSRTINSLKVSVAAAINKILGWMEPQKTKAIFYCGYGRVKDVIFGMGQAVIVQSRTSQIPR